MYNSVPIQTVCATIASLLEIPPPDGATAPCAMVTDYVRSCLGKAERVVMYNPDAVAMFLWQRYPRLYAPIFERPTLPLPVQAVMPSVTPVCFASMYTGLSPKGHGIQSYTKPVLTCETIFDACIRSGRRCAIVSTTGDSISEIFLGRDMDYFIYDTVEEVNEKTHQLMKLCVYDLLVVYNTDYDFTMHRWGPETPQTLEVLKRNCQAFIRMADILEETGAKTVLVFAPDHGCHAIDGGLGSHGLDMEEDMNILHFWQCIGPKEPF